MRASPAATTLVTVASSPAAAAAATATDAKVAPANCPAIPLGGHRIIKFGFPMDSNFGIGVDVVDVAGKVVSSTDILPFDINRIDVCVPVPAGGDSYEVWGPLLRRGGRRLQWLLDPTIAQRQRSVALPVPGQPQPPQFVFDGSLCGVARTGDGMTPWQKKLAAKRQRSRLVDAESLAGPVPIAEQSTTQ